MSDAQQGALHGYRVKFDQLVRSTQKGFFGEAEEKQSLATIEKNRESFEKYLKANGLSDRYVEDRLDQILPKKSSRPEP